MERSYSDSPEVLITHRYFWPENLSLYPAMLKDIAEWHRGRGSRVTIFTSRCVDPAARESRHAWAEEWGIRLIEIPLGVDRGGGMFRRLVNTLSYAKSLYAVLKRENFGLAIVGTTPPILPALVARMALARSPEKNYLYYIQDIAPEMLSYRARWAKRLLGRLLAFVDRGSVSSAKAVITLSREMKATLLARFSDEPPQLAVLPNYAIESPSQRGSVGPVGRPRFVFAGNQGVVQNLPHFLEAVAIASKHADFEVELIGDGGVHELLREQVQRIGLTNVAFTGVLPRAEAQRRIEAADIGVVPASPGLYWVAYPSKINSYLLAGLPVLAFAEDAASVGGWLSRHGFGLTASPTDPEVAARSLVELVGEVTAGGYDRSAIATEAARLLSVERYLADYGRIVTPLLTQDRESRHELRERSVAV